jgi:tetratricopeptide (TPR) repeat protein
MTHRIDRKLSAGTLRTVVMIGLLIAASSGCAVTGFQARPQPTDPNQRLHVYLDALQRARANGGTAEIELEGVYEPLDTHRIENEIRRLAIEFPVHVPTLLANAMLSNEVDDRENTQRFLDRVLAIDPRNANAALLRSQLAMREGNLPYARSLLQTSIALTPDSAELYEALAAVDYLGGRFDDARASLAKADKLGAPRWRMAFNRGLVEEASGNREAAFSQYAAALEDRPDFELARARSRALQAEAPSAAH